MARGAISLAELYQVFKALKPKGSEAEEAIFHLLGLDQDVERLRPWRLGAYDPSRSPEKLPKPRSAEGEAAGSSVEEISIRPRGEPLQVNLERIGIESGGEQPRWLSDPSLVALEAPVGPPEPSAPDPLFGKLQERAVLFAALATGAPKGELDLEEVIECSGKLLPLERLPRLLVPVLRHGVELLLDHSEGFAPFAFDRRQLSQAIADVVGSPRLKVGAFWGSPSRGVARPPLYEREPWGPPSSGTVVALVSDLGLGGPLRGRERAEEHEWFEFARRCHTAGCPTVAFVPFAPSRWNRTLAREFTIVHWDRRTTARSVRLAVGPGHKETG